MREIKGLSELLKGYEANCKEAERHEAETQKEIDEKQALIVEHRKNIKQLEGSIQELMSTRNKSYGSWLEEVLNPIGSYLAEKLGLKYEIVGPSGERARTTLCFFAEGTSWVCNTSYSLTVIPRIKDGVILYETGKTSDGKKHTHIGDPDGLKNETKPLPNSMEEIYTLLMELNEQEEQDNYRTPVKEVDEVVLSNGDVVKVGDIVEIIKHPFIQEHLSGVSGEVEAIERTINRHPGSVDDRGEGWTEDYTTITFRANGDVYRENSDYIRKLS